MSLLSNLGASNKEYKAVEAALLHILGDDPVEEKKLSIEDFNAIIQLDDHLKEEESKVKRVENLVDKAIDFVGNATFLREKVERNIFDYQPYYSEYYYDLISEYFY